MVVMATGGRAGPGQPASSPLHDLQREPEDEDRAQNMQAGYGMRILRTPPRVSGRSRQRGIRDGGLEKFNRIAGGILEQDLLATHPGDDLVAEAHAFPA